MTARPSNHTHVFAMALGAILAGASGSAAQAPSAGEPQAKIAPWFEDATDAVGLDFVHDAGVSGKFFMPECIGSGVALFDLDNDGRLDLYFLQNAGDESKSTNRLYRQLGNGKFQDISRGSGLDVKGRGMGVAVGDVNNDGFPDVYVNEYGRGRLFLNNGDRTFTDISRAVGIENAQWGTSASFVDYDRDGWLDLIAVNYVNYDPNRWCSDGASRRDYCGPNAFAGMVSRLFHNQGRPGGTTAKQVKFEDVTVKSGIGKAPSSGLGVFCADFDGDRWPDLFIANDRQPNHLWINHRDGTFSEEGVVRGIALNAMGQAEANMGIAIGDVNSDGLFDVVVTHLNDETNTLWLHGPRGLFRDQTVLAGLARPKWRGTGFGTLMADFDHDGDLDLAVANGAVQRTLPSATQTAAIKLLGAHWGKHGERNQLFAGDGKGRFRDVSLENAPFSGQPGVARGVASGDIDNDGDVDLLVTFIDGRARLFRNVAPKQGHWLVVRAIDPALGRDAYGAEISVRAGGKVFKRWANPGYSYLSSNDPRVHFGLGAAAAIETVEVVWPDGKAESFTGGAVDRQMLLKKGSGVKSNY